MQKSAKLLHTVYDELCYLGDGVGKHIKSCKKSLLLEINEGHWDCNSYIEHIRKMQTTYEENLSENRNGISTTICKNDLTIIALAKTLGVPVVNMESKIPDESKTYKRRIPNICAHENVKHLTFNDFLRLEKFKF